MTIATTLGRPRVLRLEDGPVRVWDAGPAAAPAIVLVHGIVANADVWRHVVPPLAGSHRVLTLDLPLGGHDLPMGPGSDLSLPGLASLVDRTMAALDVDGVTLVGNDTGGAICQAVAARHAERLGRLVLTPCDAFDNFLPTAIAHLQLVGRTELGLRLLAETLRWRWVQRLPIALGRLTVRPIPDEIVASYTGPLRRFPDTRRDFARLVRAISSRHTEEAAARLPFFDRPALVVWARDVGSFFPLAHGQRLAGLLPHARLEVLEDAGPFVAEDRPAELAEAIARFIATTRRGPVDRAVA